MRLALLALSLTLPAASSAEAPVRPRAGPATAALAPICGRDMKVRPVRAPQAPHAQRLGELPAGDLTLTVVNRVGDCIEPVTVRQGYGALEPGR